MILPNHSSPMVVKRQATLARVAVAVQVVDRDRGVIAAAAQVVAVHDQWVQSLKRDPTMVALALVAQAGVTREV